jgi:heme-degrading monooxygenase HmoA
MICRMWRGWTTVEKASRYDAYLRNDLFPRVERELSARGYLGFHLLRLTREDEVEFVTMLWFESMQAVKGFAGEDYETAVISEKARLLLSRYADRVDHYELSGSSFMGFEAKRP